MGGRGPAPKPGAIRQRRNVKPGARVLTAPAPTSAPGQGGPADHLPDVPTTERRNWQLPDHPEGIPWHQLTVEWWNHIWRSPMSGEYLETDADGLHRLAMLVDAFYRKPKAGLLSEIRLQEARFGLSPQDRARLQWEIDKGEEAGDRRRKRRPIEGRYEPLDADVAGDSDTTSNDVRGVLSNLVKPDWPVENKRPRTRSGRFRARVITPDQIEERSS